MRSMHSRDFVTSCRKFGVSPCLYVIPAMDTFEDHAAPAAYLATQMAMLRELLTRYGQIDRLWFDYWGMGCGEYGGNFDIIRGLFPLFRLVGAVFLGGFLLFGWWFLGGPLHRSSYTPPCTDSALAV